MVKVIALCGRVQFSRVLGSSELRQSNGWLTLLVVPNQLGYHRLGIILARKRLKSAVLRNAVKRQLRELAHNILPLDSGYDLVALARSAAPLDAHLPISTSKQLLCQNIHALIIRMVKSIARAEHLRAQKMPQRNKLNS